MNEEEEEFATSPKQVDQETAQKEIEAWMQYKKISDSKREQMADAEAALVQAIVDGDLEFDPDSCKLIQNLKFPIGSQEDITQLEYKPRVKKREIDQYLKGVKPQDIDGRMQAYMAALTGKIRNVLKDMDTEDMNIAESIVGFFF